ncbi:hemolysin family protein [Pseudoroseomonas globiformis]|uniref:Hemolysin family protein n=1 Tax=Teichococcus globiformis TaxID=2307229 RepID=A0ABV7FZJ6_9PROT
MSLLAELLIILFLILLNGVFAMSELAIVSSRRVRLVALQRAGKTGAATALSLMEDPQRFLPTVQVGITLVGILAGAFAGQGIAQRLSEWLVLVPGLEAYSAQLSLTIVVLCITYLSLILGELVPKQIALRNPEAVASLVAVPMSGLSRFAAPMVWLLSRSSAAVLALVGATKPVAATITEEEVKAAVAEGVEAGALETEERNMIERVLRLADKPVRALMTPRTEVEWIDRQALGRDLPQNLRGSRVTRFVVADGRIDNVLGIVAINDLLDQLLRNGEVDLAAVTQTPLILPENLPALSALSRLKVDPLGIALVMDEYGSFEGVVTASDLLEAIVGELGPESAPATGGLVRRHDGTLLLDGMLPSDELKSRLDLTELPSDGTYHTVAGFLLSLLQRVPREGDRIVWSGWRFEIIDMDGRRIDKVLVSQEPPGGS